jgi:hypothetical protein
MKKILALIFTITTLLSCTVFASAELAEESTTLMTENATAITEFSEATGGTEFTTAAEIKTEATTEAQTEVPSTVDSVDPVIIKGKGFVSFSLSDVKTNVTMVIADSKGKEYTLKFTYDNNYIVQDTYPVGEYTIKSIKSENDSYKIKDCHIVDSDKTSFTVTETDFMSVKFTATEKKELFIVGLVKREWYLLVILAVLVIAYWYKRTHRILPSQES